MAHPIETRPSPSWVTTLILVVRRTNDTHLVVRRGSQVGCPVWGPGPMAKPVMLTDRALKEGQEQRQGLCVSL